MRLRDGIGDERFRAAQTFRKADDAHARERRTRTLRRIGFKGEHGARAARLPLHQRVPRVLRQPGVDDARHLRQRVQKRGERLRVFLRALHAHRQRFDAAQNQPTVKWRERRARGFQNKAQFFRNIGAAAHQQAAQRIVVPAKIFGRAVHHNIGAQRQRILQKRRQIRIVDNQQQPVRVRLLRQTRNIRDAHHGVGGRFNKHRFRRRSDMRRNILAAAVKRRKLQPVFDADGIEQARGAAVKVGVHNQMRAGLKQLHQRGNRRHAAGEGDGVRAAFQRAHRRFQLFARGVLHARIIKITRLLHTAVRKSGALINRVTDGSVRVAMFSKGKLAQGFKCTAAVRCLVHGCTCMKNGHGALPPPCPVVFRPQPV